MTTVVVVDDHEIVRRGVRSILSAEPDLDVVADAGTYAEAAATIRAVAPDVAVVDVRLGADDGIALCGELARTAPGTHCVLFTSFADDGAVARAYDAGASAFVLKTMDPSELLGAVRCAAHGERRIQPVTPVEPQAPDGLTTQELRVVELLAEGLTNRDIAGRLALSDKTVKNYVSNVLTKLGMANRSEIAVYGARLVRRSSSGTGVQRDCRRYGARTSVGP